MASKVAKPSLIKSVSHRGYAAAAAAKESYALPTSDPKVSTLPSGTVVASLENNAPVSKVALFFKAGSRYETPATRGAAHMARLCAGTATKQFSAFHITRSLQQNGGALAAEGGREHIGYVLDINRDHLDEGLGLLTAVGTSAAFKPWEVAGQTGRLKTELATLDSSAVVLDLLHSAAFRAQGLGNSIYVPSHKIGGVSQAQLLDFAAATHTAGGLAVVGLGVDHDALLAYTKSLGLSGGAADSAGSSYAGGEIRHETGGPVTTVAVAGEGGSIGNGASAAVAQYILGTGPGTKYGGNASSKLSAVVAATGGVGAASALSASYSDSGLLGYFVVAEAAAAGAIVSGVHAAVKNLAVTEADVATAKNKLKVALLMASEAQSETVMDMGLQALLTGGYAAPAAAIAALDAVTAADVQAALGKAFGGKLSMAAVGSLDGVPYLDQL